MDQVDNFSRSRKRLEVSMKIPHALFIGFILCAVGTLSSAVPPSFRDTSSPEGWTIVRGQAETGSALEAKGAAPLDLKTSAPLDLPVDVTILLRASVGDMITVQALDVVTNTKPLLHSVLRMMAPNQINVTAHASGEAMATEIWSMRTWSTPGKRGGTLAYKWRFPKVKNLWEERDRKEIGAAYARLTPFEEKVFALRFVLTASSRQIWLDDRLVAEERAANPKQALFDIQLSKSTRMLS